MYSGVSRWLSSAIHSSLLQGCGSLDVGHRSARHERMNPLRGWTRETRLLVVTVLLAVSVLLALARLRFPGAEPSARLSLPVRPLQQIVERASFDNLAASVTRAADRIRPALAVISLRPRQSPITSRGLAEQLAAPPSIPARATALHIGDDRWVALVTGAAGPDVTSPGLTVAGQDPLRGIVVLTGNTDTATVLSTSRPALPSFLVAAEPTAAGVAVRPVFVPASEPTSDARWASPLWALPPDAPPAGSLVFSLEGAFVGAVVEVSSGTALVPADTVLGLAATIDRARGCPGQSESGCSGSTRGLPQHSASRRAPWSPGSSRAACLAIVSRRGMSSRRWTVPPSRRRRTCCSAWRLPIRRRASILDVVRGGEHVKVHVADGAEPAQSGAAPAAETRPPSTPSLGAQLVPSARGSRVRAVDPGSPAERAGLAAGDEIWWVQGTTSTGPPAVTRAWRALAPGRRLALGVDAEPPRLLAVEKP